MTHFPGSIFPNNEETKVPNNIPTNQPSYPFISCFTVSLTLLSNTPEFSPDFMILIKSLISSFGMASFEMIPFPDLTKPL